jgi:hypothetical protein
MEGVDQYIIGVLSPLTVLLVVYIVRKVKSLMDLVEKVHVMTADVDRAVNGRPADDPTIYELAKSAVDIGDEAARVGREARNEANTAARVGKQALEVGNRNSDVLIDLSDSLKAHVNEDEQQFADIQRRLPPES